MNDIPTPERIAKGDVKSTPQWINNRQHVVLSAVESPLVLDELHHQGIINDRLYSAGEAFRGIWRAVGHDSLTFNYKEKSAGPRELSDRQAGFWSLHNDICRAIPYNYKLAVLAVCCEDELRAIHLVKSGLDCVDSILSRLYHDRDSRLLTYYDYLAKGA